MAATQLMNYDFDAEPVGLTRARARLHMSLAGPAAITSTCSENIDIEEVLLVAMALPCHAHLKYY